MTAIFLASLTLSLGCGDKDDTSADDSATTTDDSGATDDTSSALDCATTSWDAQSVETKGDWMAQCLLPPMQGIFVDHDADKFGDFSCATCHTGADSGDFGQPSQIAIDFTGQDYWPSGYFVGDGSGLMEKVTAEMVGLLGTTPFDPETGEGFGCYNCHASPEG